jgi:hypothetical protein
MENVYETTRRRIRRHGPPAEYFILGDKVLFLKFVRLERARQAEDFLMIQAALTAIIEYMRSTRKRYLYWFAYAYIWFYGDTEGGMKTTYDVTEEGRFQVCVEYPRWISKEQRLASDWALYNCSRYSSLVGLAYKAMEKSKSLGKFHQSG